MFPNVIRRAYLDLFQMMLLVALDNELLGRCTVNIKQVENKMKGTLKTDTNKHV